MTTEDNVTKEATEIKPVKKRRPGIVYFSSLPYGMTITSIKAHMAKFGEIGNVFFQLADRENYVGGVVGGAQQSKKKNTKRGHLIKGRIKFSEGWIEFKSKRHAKWVAEMLNNSPVGGKKSSPYYDCLWSIKYLGSKFKWECLTRRIAYEREMRRRKLTNEVRKVTQETDQYVKASEIAERLEKRGRLGEAGPSTTARNAQAVVAIKQRLTEEEIVQRKLEKEKKNAKYKSKIMKAKSRKQAKKTDRKTEVLNLFVGKS